MQEYTLGEYSHQLEDDLWEAVGQDYDKDYNFTELSAKLGGKDFFRPFAKRLLAFYNEILRSNISADEATKDMQRLVKQNGILLNRNNIENWFSGKTEPKYGDNDRRNMFALAFALGLDVTQTERFFHKVFLDKAFNRRNAREFIYLYCIYNKKPFSAAEELIDRFTSLDSSTVPEDQTERTEFMDAALRQSARDDEILEFLSEHRHNFSLNNTAAKAHRRVLLDRLTGGTDGNGLAKQEFDRRRAEFMDDMDSSGFENRDTSSVDFLLYMIMGVDFAKKGNADIRSIREIFPRKEIYNQFPNKQTLSDTDPSAYILRKDIILLKFYDYWVADFVEGRGRGNYDGFREELNGILFDCGFSPLYIGNPYDWLFLYCSACPTEPLDVFRGILAPALE